MKTTQIHQVTKILLETGEVSRNDCLNNYITRLGAIINILNNDGWIIKGKYRKKGKSRDFIYSAIHCPYEQEIFKVESTGEIIKGKWVKK